jgi:AP endonuclease-1
MQVESKAEVKPASNGKKRKANAVDVKVTTRTKKAKSSGIEKRDTATSTDETPLSKRTSANRNPIQEGIGHDELLGKEDSDGGAKVTKKKTTTTGRKKQVDLAPLTERTKDTNLLVGAHVSTAGG